MGMSARLKMGLICPCVLPVDESSPVDYVIDPSKMSVGWWEFLKYGGVF